MKVLLVDDSKVMRQIQRRSLTTIGFSDIAEAGDGIEALQQMNGQPKPDIVILDWNMPRLDGLGTLRKIRETDTKTVVVMCTTESEKVRVIEAVKAGVNNYIVKPFTPQTLREKIDAMLAATAAAA